MKPTKEQLTQIKTAVNKFMAKRRVCWATPGTERYSSNFYGDTYECKFTRTELAVMIQCFHRNYGSEAYNDGTEREGRDNTLAESIDDIISDMQFDRPAL